MKRTIEFLALAAAMFLVPAAALFVSGWAFAAQVQNQFVLTPESRGAYSSNVRLAPTWIDARVLAANVNEDHTVPTGALWVVFSANCNFYAKPAATAAVPAADVTDGTGSELNPTAWRIAGITTIAMIAPTACIVSLSFYK